jgi:Fe2+ or Zn2+ uptake regulation protein
LRCEKETATALRSTGQRNASAHADLCALRHNDDHVTAAEVLEQVRLAYPYVDVSTVYAP